MRKLAWEGDLGLKLRLVQIWSCSNDELAEDSNDSATDYVTGVT